MQTDPIGYKAGLDLYNYAGRNPINLTDPIGFYQFCREQMTGGFPTYTGSNGDIVVEGGRYVTQCNYIPDLRSKPGFAPGGLGYTPGGGTPASNQELICPAVPTSRPVGDTGQKGAALRDPLGAYAATVARVQALVAAAAAYPNLRGIDDARDAYRHFYWVSAMARTIGLDRTLAFANSHEAEYPLKTRNDILSRNMDTFNSTVAIRMTLDPRSRGLSTADLTRRAIRNGCVRTLK